MSVIGTVSKFDNPVIKDLGSSHVISGGSSASCRFVCNEARIACTLRFLLGATKGGFPEVGSGSLVIRGPQ